MPVTRADIVAEARSWIGTPFHHQGRLKGVGVDCAGLLICVARELGLSSFDVTGYARLPDGRQLKATCERLMEPIGLDAAGPGDVVLLRWTRQPQHVAIVADGPGYRTIIHAHEQAGQCVEHILDEIWARRVVRAYRIPGVDG
jgi:NlpC/P60 family putative phage cell wall peptidase